MSLLRSIRQQLGLMSGGNESQNHFWDGSVANQLTLKRGVPDAPGATVMQVVDGEVTTLKSKLVPIAVGVVAGGGGLVLGAGFASSSRIAIGTYDLVFSTPLPDSNYVVQCTSDATTIGIIATVYGPQSNGTKVQVKTYDPAGAPTDAQVNVTVWKL